MATHNALGWFTEACEKHRVKKPNPKLVAFFREEEPIAEDIEEIDLSDNYIGNRGILALCDVIEKLPNFRTLNVAGQKLYNTDLSEDSVKGNPTVDRIVEVLRQHPSATALDVSSNPVSNYVGRKLLGLAQVNSRMCKISLDDTRIDFLLRKEITDQCAKNTTAWWESHQQDEEAEESAFGEFASDAWSAKKAPDLTNLGGGTRRKTVRSEGVDPEKAKNYKAPIIEKPSEDVDMIVTLLQSNVLFSFLGSREMRTVALAMSRQDFAQGEDILSQGGCGDALYVLQTGECDILKEGQKVFLKTAGTAVGEIELMYDTECAATVRVATSECVTWKLDRETYRNLVMGTAIRRREEYAKHLDRIPFLESLSSYEKSQVADALSTDEWKEGDSLIKYGEVGEWMFIILEGTVEVIGRNMGEKTPVCEFNAGDYVGELEFLNNHRAVADVVTKSEFVQTAKLNRRHFEMCLGPVVDVLKRNMTHPKYEYYQKVLEGMSH